MTLAEFLRDDPDKTCWAADCFQAAVMLRWVWSPVAKFWGLTAVCADHPFKYVLAA